MHTSTKILKVKMYEDFVYIFLGERIPEIMYSRYQ